VKRAIFVDGGGERFLVGVVKGELPLPEQKRKC
jgi:hypothetical protein